MPDSKRSRSRVNIQRLAVWSFIIISLGLLAYGLAWVSAICTPCSLLTGLAPTIRLWGSFLAVLALGAIVLIAGWWAIQASERRYGSPQPTRWLFGLLISAALLRLGLSVLWFTTIPVYGHNTPPEISGYVMSDAHERDQFAWKISQSQKPLFETILGNRKTDQYGGLLFISALVYRYLGPENHPPLMMTTIVAAISALAVIFTWAFARRAWSDRAAFYAAWGMALYPEVVLLGSAQMREAFIIPLVAAAFYGLLRMREDRSWVSLAWLLAGVLLTLPFSPLYTTLLVIGLGITAFAIRDDLLQRNVRITGWAWLAAAGLVLLALTAAYFALKQTAPPDMVNPLEILSWWIRKSSDLQAHFSKAASGWIQKLFDLVPEWSRIPLLVGYGILRPFLPAALIVSSQAPIWPFITIWRALGWFILLVLLVYGSLRAWSRHSNIDHQSRTFSISRALTLFIWLGIVIASLRGGGDQDDNPRYRAAFASIQVATAAWAWVEYRKSTDPWFRRALASITFIILLFIPWYLRRQYHLPWPIVDPFKLLGLGLICTVLYIIWDWARTRSKEPSESAAVEDHLQ
jgi:hypothetical protein